MKPLFRPPLPTRQIPDELRGQDTRAQAEANSQRIDAYLALLEARSLPLPAAPTAVGILGTAQVAREAGVSLGVMRPGHPLRRKVEAAIPERGLAIIVSPPQDPAALNLADCRHIFVTLAPAKAREIAVKPAVMEQSIAELFDVMERRCGDPGSPVQPLVAALRAEADADHLDLSSHALWLLRQFEEWCRDWQRLQALDVEALGAIPFAELLQIGMARTGMSQAQVARVVGANQPSVQRWLAGKRVPNARSHTGLRGLARHFGFPEEALVRAIIRKTPGHGIDLALEDFPEVFRTRRNVKLRNCVRAKLTEQELCLSTEALRRRIAELCDAHALEFAPHRQRKAMRDANAIDRSLFPPRLREQLQLYAAHLDARRRSPKTRDAYVGHLEGVLHFALSARASKLLRLDPATASIAHAASRPLWDAYFQNLETVGRNHMGAEHRLNRCIVERMKAVEALFDDQDGFAKATPDVMADLDALDPRYLPRIPSGMKGDMLLGLVQCELRSLRTRWRRVSRRPVNGRHEIADLLAHEDPMIAVEQCVAHLRDQLSGIKAYMRSPLKGGAPTVNPYYATCMRKLVMIHLLGQTALRIGMLPLVTVGRHAAAHLKWLPREAPRLEIPAHLFKNATSEFFRDGPYKRELQDMYGFYDDLRAYLAIGRPRLLDGGTGDQLFVAWRRGQTGTPCLTPVLRHEITDITGKAVGVAAPPHRRLIRAPHLRPHHFRDILATSVLRRTGSYALAADAIHVTEATARAYYAHDSVSLRRPQLEQILKEMARPRFIYPNQLERLRAP